MRRKRSRLWRWLGWLTGIGALVALLYGLNARFLWWPLPWQTSDEVMLAEGQPSDAPAISTVPVERAADFIPDLTVSGKLEFRSIYEVKAPFDETVDNVQVAAGDLVTMTQPLVALSVDKLQQDLNTAWRELTAKRQALTDLMAENSEIAVMEANAALLAAQEELTKVVKGPAAAEIQSAQLAVSEAKLAYEELLARNDPNSSKVREARFALKEAETGVQRAQMAYNAISWKGDIAASSEAAALQSATIGYERAQSAYDETVKAPTDLEVQKAQNAIAQAQSAYDKLFTAATPAQLEQAKVNVAKAQEKLTAVENGPPALKVQEAEGEIVDALNRWESVRNKLLNTATLRAPVNGQVVKVAAKPGQAVKEGDTLAVLVIPDEFKLNLAVSELYILRITPAMAVQITLDVLPGETLTGTVVTIAPPDVQLDNSQNNTSAGSGSQFTTYAVTVAVGDQPLTQRLRAGMSAQATFVGSNQLPPNAWLVPTNALENQQDGMGTIQLMRGDTPTPLEVEVTEQTQGEAVVVISDELQEGDLVVGSMASFLDAQSASPFGP